MPRKRREPSPPQPQESSSEEYSSGEEEHEDEAQGVPAPESPPQIRKPPSAGAANDGYADESSDGGDEEGESSDSKVDDEDFQLPQVERSPSKPSPAAPALGLGADEEEPEPVQKEAKKLKADTVKKRLAPEPTPSGKAKKAKANVEKALAEPTLSGQDKKAKSGAEKATPELTPSGKAKKLKAEPKKAALDSLTPSKKKWTLKDEIMILEAALEHVKTKSGQPSTGDLLAAVGDSLSRKKCSYTEMYEKVRHLKRCYVKVATVGVLPSKGDELQKYRLSEAVWGENAKEVVALASISQKVGTPSKSKKRLSNIEKMDVHSKGGTSKEATTANEETVLSHADGKKELNNIEKMDVHSKGGTSKEATTAKGETVLSHADGKKEQATDRKIDGDTKSRSSKKASTTDVPAKNKDHGYHKEEPVENAKTSKSKEATTAVTEEKMDGGAKGHGPKDATVATQNGGTLTQSKNAETQDGMNIDANVQRVHKGLNELRNLYPNLTSYMERITAQHPCGDTLMRAFHFIDDQKASALESKIKKQIAAEVKMEIRQGDTKKEVAIMVLKLVD